MSLITYDLFCKKRDKVEEAINRFKAFEPEDGYYLAFSGAWVRKAYESAQNGATVVCLLPARTDTAWWHDYCMHGDITFERGRIKFGGSCLECPIPFRSSCFQRRCKA